MRCRRQPVEGASPLPLGQLRRLETFPLRWGRAYLRAIFAQRRLSRRGPRQAEPDAEGDDAIASLPESSALGPEAQTLDREFEQIVERALDQLPADWRAAVVLRDLEGLSTQEAAEVAGVREAAFKSRLHRGRMQLRALLEPYLQLDEG